MHGHSFKVWWLAASSPFAAALFDVTIGIVVALAAFAFIAHGWRRYDRRDEA